MEKIFYIPAYLYHTCVDSDLLLVVE